MVTMWWWWWWQREGQRPDTALEMNFNLSNPTQQNRWLTPGAGK